MSDPESFFIRSEKDLFFEALELDSPQARAAFLDEACGSDPVGRNRVEELLAGHFQEDVFMLEPAVDVPPAPVPLGQTGRMLGRYKLLEKIGEGGFGEVWMAEQLMPVKRRVALKIIKPGMDSRQVVARFEAERQALAMMDHPNIASIFDADITEGGRPYFVMELVRGVRITDYCNENRLPARARLDLFIKVCQAIQHAHQKGIIHRDIKPNNILVTLHDGVPVPKVIDFGIAKATQEELTDKTVFTQFHHFIGTPAYISPEQAEMSGLNVDTRADIYSLGILLYELLVGQPPFEIKKLVGSGYDEMRRIIREVDPARPSSRIATMGGGERRRLAHDRALEPGKLDRLVAPDLDWIVMKAIDKDRTRRYGTASAFAQDLLHFLADEPVSAMPPSAWYQFTKFAKRHKTALRFAVAIVAVLLAATVVSTWQAVRAMEAEQWARKSEAVAQSEAARANVQKRVAEENLALTEKAEKEATRQRIRADGEAETAQQNLFSAEMHLAGQAWREHRGLGRMEGLLTKWIPADGAPDRRGWEWFYLNALPFRNQITLREGSQDIARNCTVAWHIPSRRLAEGAADGSIRIRDTDRDRTVRILKGPEPGVSYWGGRVLAWKPDGRQLAAAGRDGTVHLWDTDSGRTLHVLQHGRQVLAIAYNPDGTEIAAWEDHGRISLWNTTTGALHAVVIHPGKLSTGVWSPDGKLLASGNNDGEVILSRPAAGAPTITLGTNSDTIFHLEWSPDSTRLASTNGNDFFVRVWDVASQKVVLGPLRHSHSVTAMAWEPDGRRLATGSVDETVMIWNTSTGFDPVVLRGQRETVNSLSWGPDGQLASGAADGSLKIWESTRDQETDLLPGEGRETAVAWSPDGQQLAAAGDDGIIRIRNSGTATASLTINAHDRSGIIPQFGLIRSLDWSPDGKFLASAGLDGTAKIWEVPGGRQVFALPADHGPVWSVAWSPDGTRLAAGSMDGCIRLVEGLPGTPEVIHVFQAHEDTRSKLAAHSGVRSLAWSPKGDILASGGFDQLIKLWDPAGRAVMTMKKAHQVGVMGIAWSPDGTKLASAGGDSFLMVWEARTGEKLRTMGGHNDFVDAVAWSPDGTRLASAGLDTSVRIWDPESGNTPLVLRGVSGMFHDISWNADGARLAAASSDGQIWIWDATRGYERDTTARGLPYIDRRIASGTARGLELSKYAQSYLREGKPEEAVATVENDFTGLSELSQVLYQDNPPLAESIRLKALTLWKQFPPHEPMREMTALEAAHLMLISGRFEDAVAALKEFSIANPEDTMRAVRVAVLQVWLGQQKEHAVFGRSMLDWAVKAAKPEDMERVAKLILIDPKADSSLREAALSLARKGVELGRNSGWLNYFKASLGMADYRNGRYAEAEVLLQGMTRDADRWKARADVIMCTAGLYRAMSLFQLGRHGEARTLFALMQLKMEPLPHDEASILTKYFHHDLLILWMTFREAKALLGNPADNR